MDWLNNPRVDIENRIKQLYKRRELIQKLRLEKSNRRWITDSTPGKHLIKMLDSEMSMLNKKLKSF